VTRWFYVSLILPIVALSWSLYIWFVLFGHLPAEVPTHWNFEGKPDAFTPRENVLTPLLIVPLVMFGFALLTLALPWLSPKHFEVDRFRNVFQYIMAVVVGFFAYMHVIFTLSMLQVPVDVTRWLLGGTLLLFALLGNVMGKVRRNFYVGIRTPWTLASETVWEATHRLGAWLFVIAGVGGFLLMMVGVPFWFCFGGAIALILVPIPYSLYLYKRLEREGKLDLEPVATQTVNDEGKA
jgi:uncharacterized membrane protein